MTQTMTNPEADALAAQLTTHDTGCFQVFADKVAEDTGEQDPKTLLDMFIAETQVGFAGEHRCHCEPESPEVEQMIAKLRSLGYKVTK